MIPTKLGGWPTAILLFAALLLLPATETDATLDGESYREEVVFTPIGKSLLLSQFVFQTSSSKARDHVLFPWGLHQLQLSVPFSQLDLALTKGRWDFNSWGAPPPRTATPSGLELSVAFPSHLSPSSTHDMWGNLTQALSGMVCASLAGPAAPTLLHPKLHQPTPTEPAAQPALRWLHLLLPQEGVCTENLTPLLKLLPCRGLAGPAGLLLTPTLHAAHFYSLQLHVSGSTQAATPSHSTRQLTLIVNIVHPATLTHIPESGSTPAAPAAEHLHLSSLFPVPQFPGSCALASSSAVYIVLPTQQAQRQPGLERGENALPQGNTELEENAAPAGNAAPGENAASGGDAAAEEDGGRVQESVDTGKGSSGATKLTGTNRVIPLARRENDAWVLQQGRGHRPWLKPTETRKHPTEGKVDRTGTETHSAGSKIDTAEVGMHSAGGRIDTADMQVDSQVEYSAVVYDWKEIVAGGKLPDVVLHPEAVRKPARSQLVSVWKPQMHAVITGPIHGRLMIRMSRENRHLSASQSAARESEACLVQVIPNHMRVWLHSSQLMLEGRVVPLESHLTLLHLTPPSSPSDPFGLQLCLALPASVTTASLSWRFSKAFKHVFDHPPDAARGLDIPPVMVVTKQQLQQAGDKMQQAGASVHDAGATPSEVLWDLLTGSTTKVYSEVLVTPISTPDFSMPYNVCCLSCTLLAVFFGTTLNSLMMRGKEVSAETDSQPNKRIRTRVVKMLIAMVLMLGLLYKFDEATRDGVNGVLGMLGLVPPAVAEP